MTDGTAKLISDSLLVAINDIQMRRGDYLTMAEDIVPRIHTLTGENNWNCIVGEKGKFNWKFKHCCDKYIVCETDSLKILLFTIPSQ